MNDVLGFLERVGIVLMLFIIYVVSAHKKTVDIAGFGIYALFCIGVILYIGSYLFAAFSR